MPLALLFPHQPTVQRKKEILADVRVIKSVQAGRGGRVRDAQEAAQASRLCGLRAVKEAAGWEGLALGSMRGTGLPALECAALLMNYLLIAPPHSPGLQAKSITVTSDGREKAAEAQAAAQGAAPSSSAAQGGAPANVAEARQWIAAWRAKSGSQGGGAAASGSSQEVPANVAEAREWIRRWRAAQLEKQLPKGSAVSQ